MTEIVETEGTLGGKPRIAGTRVSAEQVYEMHTEQGMSPREIGKELPTVTAEDARAAIQYMEDHEGKTRTADMSA